MAIKGNLGGMLSTMGRGNTSFIRPDKQLDTATAPPKINSASPGRPDTFSINPNAVTTLTDSITVLPNLPIFLPEKTTTQIAQSAIALLNSASQAVLQEGVNTVKNRRVEAGNLMNYLERKVKIGEALSQLAAQWSADTKQDFAEAFQMTQDKLEVMDVIVSLAVLNDPDLTEELQIENTPETTTDDLLENRRIVWQYPPPGTVLQPPFLVLLAVEHRDTKRAEEVLQSIIGVLVDHEGYKLPRAAVQKLTGRTTFTAADLAVNPTFKISRALENKLNR
jgi:hypothetical protein